MRAVRPHGQLAGERCLAIVSSRNLFRLEWLKDKLGQVFPRLNCIAPRSLDHLAEVVRRSGDTHKVLITVGGDGTFNRVINAAHLSSQVLGLLPLGTGNDLARTLCAPRSPYAALRWLSQTCPRPTDLVSINGVLSHNSAGFGLDCATLKVRDASQGLAHRSYHFAFLLALRSLRPLRMRLEADGLAREGGYMWVLGMNARYIGGGTLVAPMAVLDDGLMEVVLFEAMSPARMLGYLPRVIKGRHLGLPGIVTFRCQRLSCTAEAAVDYVAADGETYYQLERQIDLEVRPAALQLLR